MVEAPRQSKSAARYARSLIDKARRDLHKAHAVLMRAVAATAAAERKQQLALEAKDKARDALGRALELYAKQGGRKKDMDEAGIW